MMKAVLESPLFGIVLSILAYEAGLWVNRKLKTPLANPLLIAVTLIVGLMMLFHIPLESYQKGGDLIALFLAQRRLPCQSTINAGYSVKTCCR